MEMRELLFSKLSGYNLNDRQIEQLESYHARLLEEGKKLNLTSLTDPEEIAVKHFLDSLSGEDLIPLDSNVLDIGSGAGFPSIPIAIMREDISYTLVEATSKKADFLRLVVDSLGLKNVRVVSERAENLAFSSLRESFDVVTSRAVAPLNELVELSVPFLKINGIMLAYKAAKKDEEIANANGATKKLKCDIIKEKTFMLDEKYFRSIIVLRKQEKTDIKYPRAYKKIISKPL